MTIRNPIEWSLSQLRHSALAVGTAGRALHHVQERLHTPPPLVARIAVADLRDALRRGAGDFAACRTDVIFLCVVYPIVGLFLGRAVFGGGLLPLLFPLASGFALVGPLAAVGLYELSRRREQGREIGWADAIAVTRSPSFGTIVVFGLLLMAIFILWLIAAETIYKHTLGPAAPISAAAFSHALVATAAGWELTGIGIAVGFVFAVVVMTISVVSIPLLLDRDVGLDTAIWTSVRAVAANPGTMALWGLIVAGGLVLGSVPFFIGLVIVMPLLGHATWHLYRKLVR